MSNIFKFIIYFIIGFLLNYFLSKKNIEGLLDTSYDSINITINSEILTIPGIETISELGTIDSLLNSEITLTKGIILRNIVNKEINYEYFPKESNLSSDLTNIYPRSDDLPYFFQDGFKGNTFYYYNDSTIVLLYNIIIENNEKIILLIYADSSNYKILALDNLPESTNFSGETSNSYDSSLAVIYRLFGSSTIGTTLDFSTNSGCKSYECNKHNLLSTDNWIKRTGDYSDLFYMCNNSNSYKSSYIENNCNKETCCENAVCSNGIVKEEDCKSSNEDSTLKYWSNCGINDDMNDCNVHNCCVPVNVRVQRIFDTIKLFSNKQNEQSILGKDIRNYIYYIFINFTDIGHYLDPIISDTNWTNGDTYNSEVYDRIQDWIDTLDYNNPTDLAKIILKNLPDTFTFKDLRDNWIGMSTGQQRTEAITIQRLFNTINYFEIGETGEPAITMNEHININSHLKKFIILLDRCNHDEDIFYGNLNPLDSILVQYNCHGRLTSIDYNDFAHRIL